MRAAMIRIRDIMEHFATGSLLANLLFWFSGLPMILDAGRVDGTAGSPSAVPTAVKASIDLALLGIAFLEFLNPLRELLDRGHRVRTGGAGPPDSKTTW
jgi:hypothetical protein